MPMAPGMIKVTSGLNTSDVNAEKKLGIENRPHKDRLGELSHSAIIYSKFASDWSVRALLRLQPDNRLFCEEPEQVFECGSHPVVPHNHKERRLISGE